MTMSDEITPAGSVHFSLSLRQRRLRMATLGILAVIVAMIALGVAHPFFHPHPPAALTHHVRQLFAVRAMLILGYWSVCFLLACSLVIIAWLDVREIRLRMLMARRDIWQDLAERQRERSRERRPRE